MKKICLAFLALSIVCCKQEDIAPNTDENNTVEETEEEIIPIGSTTVSSPNRFAGYLDGEWFDYNVGLSNSANYVPDSFLLDPDWRSYESELKLIMQGYYEPVVHLEFGRVYAVGGSGDNAYSNNSFQELFSLGLHDFDEELMDGFILDYQGASTTGGDQLNSTFEILERSISSSGGEVRIKARINCLLYSGNNALELTDATIICSFNNYCYPGQGC